MLTYDFETYYDKEFSLSKMTTEAYIRDPRFQVIGVSVKKDDGPIEWITGSDEYIAQRLKGLGFETQACIAHNAVFDGAILNWKYGIRPKVHIDTLSMSRPVTGLSCGGSLRALSEYFGIGHKGTEIYNTLGKRREDFTPEELARFGEYCQQDVNLTHQLYFKLLPYTTLQEMYLIDLTLRMFTEPVLELNEKLLADHLVKVREDKEALLESVARGNRDAFMSNNMFAELLRAEGVEPPTKVSAKTGKPAYAFAKTDSEFQALFNHPNERVQALASARLGLKSTIEETRTEAFLAVARRGLLPIMLNYYGAVNTGRFSGGDKLNPQNLPRGGVLREAIQAPEGCKLVACDSSNIEARVLAWFAGQTDLVDQFRHGVDVYSAFASKIYERPINKYENPNERHVGKTCVLGLGYQVGAAKLQHTLENGLIRIVVSLDDCQRIVKLYRSTYDKIALLWRDCQKQITQMSSDWDGWIGVGIHLKVNGSEKSVTLPNGMKLRYPGLICQLGERGWPEYSYQKKQFRAKLYGGALTENIVQALARIIVSYQMCRIKQELDKMSREKQDGKIRRVVHMVHDEVIVVVPEDEAEQVKNMMERIMKTPPKWAPDLPVSCEVGIGRTYVEAK